MYLLQRCVFRQPFLICLYFFSLLFLSTFLHLQDRIIYQKLRLFFKTTSSCPLLELNNASYPCSSSSQAMDRGMWTINSRGRLGNQMGQYATLYALAKLNGHQAYILPTMHRYLAPLFRLTLPVIPSEVVNKIPWREYYLHDWMLEEHRHIQGKYVQLTGYPCSFTFYDHIHQEILQEFSFHDHVKAESNRYLLGLQGKRKNVTYIGVHVRRGDYVKRMPNYWRGVVADRGYLQKAMDYFREKYLNPIFVVVSNGMNWCKKNINAARGDVYFVDDRWVSSPGRDFALIAHCNHTIMTIGTFGFWAGYLAGGETVYLANFTLPDSPFLKIFRPSAAFLPGWIGIPADLSPLLPKTPAKSLLSKSSSHNLEQTAGNAC